MSLARPALFTFDIFGTVLDWRRGLGEDLAKRGQPIDDADFDHIIDSQGREEQLKFRPYSELTAASLVEVLQLNALAAAGIGVNVGRWPLFADSAQGLRRLQAVAPCVAMTNSDREHGEQVQEQLGFRLSSWICAEEVKLYKPNPAVWTEVAKRRGVTPSKAWWHVSAYADYDLEVARSLGLTCVFVERPHSRPGARDVTVTSLTALAALAEAL